MNKIIDISGKRFNKLIVIKDTGSRNTKGEVIWLCQCDCGEIITVPSYNIRSGNTQLCGCLQKFEVAKANYKHGMCNTTEYRTWHNIKQRCYDLNNKRYNRYGGRGIKVCKQWLNSFEQFYKDMGKKPKGLTIERINNDGNYEPTNCKWATWKEQANNRNNGKFKEVK